MMFDYSAIMLNIQNNLADYYSKNSLPCGEGKSLQFERTATEIIRDTFSSADRSSGYSQEYHSVEYLGGNVFPDVVVHIGQLGEKSELRLNITFPETIGKLKATVLSLLHKSMV